MIKKYFKIWWMMMSLAAQVALRSSLGAIIFFIAKFLRFALFIVFIALLQAKTKTIAGYSIWQMVFFFATFNLVDLIPQFLFREVYRFRGYVVKGEFDYILTKPYSPLFRSLLGGSDILDLPMLILAFGLIFYTSSKLGPVNLTGIILYFLLVANAFVIALAFHIFTISIGILTTEVDNTIMLYRDITQMGRIPVDIYLDPVRSILTFAIPVGIMMTFPPKVLMGLLSAKLIIFALLFGITFLYLATSLWRYSLRHYQSASS